MKTVRLAFVGFRHGHVMGLYKAAREHPRVEVVAACEEHAETAASLTSAATVQITHTSYPRMLDDVACDAIAVGDTFRRRGSIIIRALAADKHVIADKPICTRLEELAEIEQLVAKHDRRLGCLLDLRDTGALITMRRLIHEGAIGDVHTVNFTAQHPLLLGKRPAWYFEPGQHGGTINDIAVHAIDLIPWLTGRRIAQCVAARAWNARLPQFPQFQDAAQLMLKLDNGGGVLGDVSYLTPDGVAYAAPQYWRVTCHGSDGLVEANYDAKTVMLARSAEKTVNWIDSDDGTPGGVLESFLDDIAGAAKPGGLRTADVIDASRRSLLIQDAADNNRCNVSLLGR